MKTKEIHKKKGVNMSLEEAVLKKIPEANWIVNVAHKNSQQSGAGRSYGELTKKELLSFAEAIIKHHEVKLDAAEQCCRIYFEIAADVIGEDEVRRLHDKGVDALIQKRRGGDED